MMNFLSYEFSYRNIPFRQYKKKILIHIVKCNKKKIERKLRNTYKPTKANHHIRLSSVSSCYTGVKRKNYVWYERTRNGGTKQKQVEIERDRLSDVKQEREPPSTVNYHFLPSTMDKP